MLVDPPHTLETYVAAGGGTGIDRARHLGAVATIDELATAGLRGRGGAGFPTATKWRSLRTGGGGTRYAVGNAAEGEPGTFKDRALLRANPYAVIEGLVIAALTIGAGDAYLAIKATFTTEIARLRAAMADMAAERFLGDVEVHLVTGPEEYLFGEEKALLEVIEGNEPLPRWLPPYLHGLYATAPQLGWEAAQPSPNEDSGPGANPTLVNNAETLAQAAWILGHGADAFRAVGTEGSPGTVLATLVGDVARPAVFEVPMGTPLSRLVELAGGMVDGRGFKAAFPGVASAALTAADSNIPLTYEDFEQIGSGLGAAGFMVYDDTACMVEVSAALSRFLYVESCGQCLPCKLGTGHITGALDRIRDGTGTEHDLDLIEEQLRVVADGNRCYLPVQERNLVSSVLRGFPADFVAHLDGWCPSPRTDYPLPKLIDLAAGVAHYDPDQARKQPDWTYR
ncbi:MAG: SLBB domain-containing protein [Actinomycetota bacterium]|nr:SLBB domain-containing protein [Actinomycetota bacterium]